MRWLLALSLAACSTTDWQYDNMTDQTRPLVLEKLHDAQGEARVVVSDRYYIVRESGLQPEIGAVLSAVADAVRKGSPCPGSVPPPEDPGPVIALPRLDRGLTVGDVAVEHVDCDPNPRYCVTIVREWRQYIATEVPATASIDAAFEALIAEARRRAVLVGTTNVGGSAFFLETGVDIRGTGWSAPAETSLADPSPPR